MSHLQRTYPWEFWKGAQEAPTAMGSPTKKRLIVWNPPRVKHGRDEPQAR